MRRILYNHLLSIALVSGVFILLILVFFVEERSQQFHPDPEMEAYLQMGILDLDTPLHRALFRDVLDTFYPDSGPENDSLLSAIDHYRREKNTALATGTMTSGGLSFSRIWQLLKMYLKFIFAYLVVMLLTSYGVKTLAVLRFVRMKQERTSYLAELAAYLTNTSFPGDWKHILDYLLHSLALFAKATARGLLYLILFSPAYVIAYSFKTRFDTDSFLFMVLLGVVSNGLLITYAQKFYTFLVSEDRKGYVLTAVVKNLKNAYDQKSAEGIPWKQIFRLYKRFPGHVFQHIYLNARHQYLSTIKEQASFLITGLVIIEMALNIQGHLCYELLQNILYRQYDVVLTIILGIFLVVKATEIWVDLWWHTENRRYANR